MSQLDGYYSALVFLASKGNDVGVNPYLFVRLKFHSCNESDRLSWDNGNGAAGPTCLLLNKSAGELPW